jgi:AraC-like DNA-binding protein
MPDLSIKINRERYKQSQEKGRWLYVDSIIMRLKNLLEVEKIYADPELSIAKTSEKLQISIKEAAEIFSKNFPVNFQTLVNNYRVENAKSLLLDNSDETLLKIARRVGFKSKSAFIAAFEIRVDATRMNFAKRI